LIKKTLILPLLAVAAIAAGCGSDSSTSSAGYGEPTAAATGTAAPDKPAPAQAAQAPADNDAAASDDAATSDAAADPIAVDIADFAFAPKQIQAKVGQTITFTNKDSAPHTATATDGAKFDSGQLDQGKSFSYTAKKAGTIQFVCSFHPNMTGTITVS
jgi:plastocyanin